MVRRVARGAWEGEMKTPSVIGDERERHKGQNGVKPAVGYHKTQGDRGGMEACWWID